MNTDEPKKRSISGRTWLVIIIILILIVAAGEYAINSNSHGPREIDITIVETNPVLQLDHFFPDNFTTTVGQNVTLAILNGDDEVRVFTIPQYNINETLNPGEAARVSVTMNQPGTFLFYSPITPPSPVSQGRDGPCLNGTLTVGSGPTNATAVSGFAAYLKTACTP